MTESKGIVSCLRLDLPVAGFGDLTYPRFRPMLAGEHSQDRSDTLAVGAYASESRPVGLVLTAGDDDKGTRRVLSLAVAADWRRRGIATRLLGEMEAWARSRGSRRLVGFYSDKTTDRPAIEGLLGRCGWSTPAPHEHRVLVQPRRVLETMGELGPVFARLHRQGFNTRTWDVLTVEDRRQIQALVIGQLENPTFAPDRVAETLEPRISVALRRHEDVVGWLIAEPSLDRPNAFHYYSGWVIPGLQRTGWLMGGMIDVGRRQIEAFGRESLSVFEISPENDAMVHLFGTRVLARVDLWKDVRYSSQKQL